MAAEIPPKTLQQLNRPSGTTSGCGIELQQPGRLPDIAVLEAVGDHRRDRLPQEGRQDPRRAAAVLRGHRQERQLHRHRPPGLRRGPFHCLLDGDLFLPESWSDDRTRCRAAGIPEALVYRPKWQIALELYDRARGNGVAFAWVTFDEGYGGKPEFLRGLIARGQRFVGEVPGS